MISSEEHGSRARGSGNHREESTVSELAQRRQDAFERATPSYRRRFDELVSAAGQVFARKGYREATIADIAEELGADRSSIYYYIESKEQVFRHVVEDALESNVVAVEEIAGRELSAPRMLRALVVRVMRSFTSYYPYLYVYLQQDMEQSSTADDAWGEEMQRLSRRFDAAVIKIIEKGIRDGSIEWSLRPNILMYSILGMLNSTYRWFRPNGELSSEEIGMALADALIFGLGTTARDQSNFSQ